MSSHHPQYPPSAVANRGQKSPPVPFDQIQFQSYSALDADGLCLSRSLHGNYRNCEENHRQEELLFCEGGGRRGSVRPQEPLRGPISDEGWAVSSLRDHSGDDPWQEPDRSECSSGLVRPVYLNRLEPLYPTTREEFHQVSKTFRSFPQEKRPWNGALLVVVVTIFLELCIFGAAYLWGAR